MKRILFRNTRKTVAVSGAPPKASRGSSSIWRRASAPFALSIFLFAGVSAFASVDHGLIALIPANSKLVAGIDVVQCRGSQFGQFVLSKSQAGDEHFDEFMTQTGFDPRRDLDSVVVTSSSPEDNSKNSPFAILARGSFDQAKISATAMAKGAVAGTYQNVSILVSQESAQKGGQQIAIAFPDTGMAVMGDLNSVHQVIQNLTTPAKLDVDLTNHIDLAGSANDAWFVSTSGAGMLGKQFSAQTGGQMGQMQALQSIRAASGGVKFGSTVAVTFDAGTRSDQDATSLADVFRFLGSMLQMQRQQNARTAIMASAIDNMQVAASGQNVHIAFSMSEQNLEQMADTGPASKH
jgi:hypothetical protein